MTIKELLDKYTKQAEEYREERDNIGEDALGRIDDYQRNIECDVLYNKCLEIVQDLRKIV